MNLDLFAYGFIAVAVLNIVLIRKKGIVTLGIALTALFMALGTFLLTRSGGIFPTVCFVLAGVTFIATALVQSALRKTGI